MFAVAVVLNNKTYARYEMNLSKPKTLQVSTVVSFSGKHLTKFCVQ